jgi:hypothetical protein
VTGGPSRSSLRGPQGVARDGHRSQWSLGERNQRGSHQDHGEAPSDSWPLQGAFLIPPALPVVADCPHRRPGGVRIQHPHRVGPSEGVLRRGRLADRAMVLTHRRNGALLRRGQSLHQASLTTASCSRRPSRCFTQSSTARPSASWAFLRSTSPCRCWPSSWRRWPEPSLPLENRKPPHESSSRLLRHRRAGPRRAGGLLQQCFRVGHQTRPALPRAGQMDQPVPSRPSAPGSTGSTCSSPSRYAGRFRHSS